MRGLLKRSGKRTVCGMVSSRNQKPPSWEKARVATALYHAEAFVCLLKSAPSRIMRARALRLERLGWICAPTGMPWCTSSGESRHERQYRDEDAPRPAHAHGRLFGCTHTMPGFLALMAGTRPTRSA